MSLEVTYEPTRNPHSVKFEVSRPLIPPGTGLPFSDSASAQNHPLAKALFDIPGVASVYILGNCVQVTKEEAARWGRIKSQVEEVLLGNG